MSQSAWALQAIDELRRVDSWTGRIHIHKLLYLGSRLLDIKTPFEFELYRFGPYSFDLDDTIRDLSVADLISREYRHPGYGPTYSSRDGWRKSVPHSLDPTTIGQLQHLAKEIGSKQGGNLELIATCCWVEQDNDISDDDEIIRRVRELKPKYNEETIRKGLQEYRQLRQALSKSA